MLSLMHSNAALAAEHAAMRAAPATALDSTPPSVAVQLAAVPVAVYPVTLLRVSVSFTDVLRSGCSTEWSDWPS